VKNKNFKKKKKRGREKKKKKKMVKKKKTGPEGSRRLRLPDFKTIGT